MPEEHSQDDLEALDALLDEVQSDDQMHHENEPEPEDISDDSLPIPESPPENTKAEETGQIPESQEETNNLEAYASEALITVNRLGRIIMTRSAEDRLEVQEAIDSLKQETVNGDNVPASKWEALATLLKVKTDSTTNLTKAGDMITKAMSAGKDHIGKPEKDETNMSKKDLNLILDALEQGEYEDETQRLKMGDSEPSDNVVNEEN
jgi:hypothetical protein